MQNLALGCSELAPMKLLIVVCIGVNHVVQKWAQFKPGPVKRIHGYCDCGARIDYEKQ